MNDIKSIEAKWKRQRKRAEDLCEEIGQEYPPCGFDIGDGWFEPVAKCLRGIAKLTSKWKLEQVKQKFCGLRIYVEYSEISTIEADEISRLIKEAELACDTRCESCGTMVEGGMASGMKLCANCGIR